MLIRILFSNLERSTSETEAHKQDRRDLDTMVLIETAFPYMEKNKDKSAPVTHKQTLLPDLELYIQGSLGPQMQIWNIICINARLAELAPQNKAKKCCNSISHPGTVVTSKVFAGFFCRKNP